MDLFRDIEKGKFGSNPHLKKEAKHELHELGGKNIAEAHEKKVKMASKMQSKEYKTTRCGHCGKFGHHHSEHSYTGHYEEDSIGRIRQKFVRVKSKPLSEYLKEGKGRNTTNPY